MKFDDFANIMAMYPTTPNRVISDTLGIPLITINYFAYAMGLCKAGRKCKRPTSNYVVYYNALTGEVNYRSKNDFKISVSKKPVKLKVGWNEL